MADSLRYRVLTHGGELVACVKFASDAAAIVIARDVDGYSIRNGPAARDIVLRYKRSCCDCQQIRKAVKIITANETLPLADRLHVL